VGTTCVLARIPLFAHISFPTFDDVITLTVGTTHGVSTLATLFKKGINIIYILVKLQIKKHHLAVQSGYRCKTVTHTPSAADIWDYPGHCDTVG
jgi:hypothetical protein